MRKKILPFIFLFLGIPWFWSDNYLTIILGLPLWVINAIAMSFFASITIAILLSETDE